MLKCNSGVFESPYWLRYLSFAAVTGAKQSVFDYKYFPYKTYKGVKQSGFEIDVREDLPSLKVHLGKQELTVKELAENSDTKSFIVFKDGKIVYQYFDNQVTPLTPLLAYSVTKSFFSTYIGCLVDAGMFSLDDELHTFGLRLSSKLQGRTVRSIMNMESGIKYVHGHRIDTDMVKFWFSPNLRKSLGRLRYEADDERQFFYNDVHLHILANLLDYKVADLINDFYCNFLRRFKSYGEVKICLDSTKKRMPKFDGGLALAPYDFLKLGVLYLNNGRLNGEQLVSESWCRAIKSSKDVRLDLPYWTRYKQMNHRWYPILKEGKTYYKNLWWGREQHLEQNDIYAMGILGQFIYVSTQNNVVIVRQGNSWGIEGWWPSVFEELAGKI